MVLLIVDHSVVSYQPPDTYRYPGGVGVVFSNDLGQLRVGSVSVHKLMQGARGKKLRVQNVQIC